MKDTFEEIVNNALKSLFQNRIIFHSEADFQHALAMTIAENENIKIRLEKPCTISGDNQNGNIKIDIELTANEDEKDFKYAIELKYKTKKFNCTYFGENFDLKTQGAQPNSRYDFWKDCERITKLENFCGGCVIFLTNDALYNITNEKGILIIDKVEDLKTRFPLYGKISGNKRDLKTRFPLYGKISGNKRDSKINLSKSVSLGEWESENLETKDVKSDKNNIFYYIIAKI